MALKNEIIKKKIIFITFNRLGYACLEEIIAEALVEVACVYTLEPELTQKVSDYQDISPVCHRHNIPLKKIKNINQEIADIKEINPDIIFIIGWSQIVKPEIFNIPPLGCVGSHPALLPKNRGRAAIPWHFINQEKYGGVTLFFIDEGCDSGDIIDQSKFILNDKDNALTYYTKMQVATLRLIRRVLPSLINHTAKAKPQRHNQATYLLPRAEQDSYLDFCTMSTRQIFNQIRAVAYVYPTAYAFYEQKKIGVLESSVVPKKYQIYSATPGQIIKTSPKSLWVKTLDGIIELKKLTFSGKPLSDYLSMFKTGHRFND